jgi:hypothetical protein
VHQPLLEAEILQAAALRQRELQRPLLVFSQHPAPDLLGQHR